MQILNRKSAPQVIRFFDLCFKKGVNDASEMGDDMAVRDFISQHKSNFSFGLLTEPDVDWQYFRVHMYQLARVSHLGTLANNFIFRIIRKDPIWCLLPYCMQFYIMGMEEWLEYPSSTKLVLFNSQPRLHWDPKAPIKKISTLDYIGYMHEIAHEYRKMPEEERPISAETMDGFVKAVYTLTRKYATKSQDRDEDF